MSEQEQAALSENDWAQLSEQYALVYGWFATLYAVEISESVLSDYLSGEAAPLLEGFAALGLGAEARRLQAAIDTLRDLPDAHLELAADFAQLFLLDAKTGALPYASAYEAGQTRLYGPAEERMRAFLANASLAIQDEFKEPADHLAIYLAVMERLVTQQAHTADISAAARDQASFLTDALLAWLPLFAARNQKASPRFDFYPALAALLCAFVEHAAGFVRTVAKQSQSAPASGCSGQAQPDTRLSI